MAEKKKKAHKGKSMYVSQFSMGALDFERLHMLFSERDQVSMIFECGDVKAMKPYFAILKAIYMNIKHMVIDQSSMDAHIAKTKANIDTFEDRKTPMLVKKLVFKEVGNNLDEFSNKVLHLKQTTGLGIEIQKVMSQKKKWDRALGVSGD